MDQHQWETIQRMADAVEDVKGKVSDLHARDERLDERILNHREEDDRRFASVHKRIDDVRSEVRADAGKAGAVTGSVPGIIAIIWATIKDSVLGNS